ncbi:MAG: DUF5684 domain-containing protein [Nitrospirota bacterium]
MKRISLLLFISATVILLAGVLRAQESNVDFEKAIDAYNQGRYEEAIGHLEAYATDWPEAYAYYFMGYAYYKLGKFQKANENFDQAFLIDPEYSPTPWLEKKLGHPLEVARNTRISAQGAIVESPEERIQSSPGAKVAALAEKKAKSPAPQKESPAPSGAMPERLQPVAGGMTVVSGEKATVPPAQNQESGGEGAGEKTVTVQTGTLSIPTPAKPKGEALPPPPPPPSASAERASPAPAAGEAVTSAAPAAGQTEKAPPEPGADPPPPPSVQEQPGGLPQFPPMAGGTGQTGFPAKMPVWMSLVAAGMGMVTLLIAAAFYLYFSFCQFVIARKLGVPLAWFSFIPILNFWPLVGAAGKPWWWVLLLFIPLVNLILIIYIWVLVTENMGKNKFLGLLILVPVVNFFYPLFLALAKPPSAEGPSSPASFEPDFAESQF